MFYYFFSLHLLKFTIKKNKKKDYEQILDETLREIPVKFNLSGLEKLYAANEERWDGVRASISLVRNITVSINTILTGFQNSGLFNLTGTYTANTGIFKIKLVMNNPETISLTNNTPIEFSNRLILWKSSTNEKYLEIFFDDPKSSSNDGAVIIVEPAVMDTIYFNTGKRMECYTNTQGKTMTCSWEGRLDKFNGVAEKAQIIVKDLDNVITVNGLIRIESTISTSIESSLESAGCNESGSGRYYYTLLAVIKNTSPYYTTAAFGIKKDGKSKNLGTCQNIYNYGYFNINANQMS